MTKLDKCCKLGNFTSNAIYVAAVPFFVIFILRRTYPAFDWHDFWIVLLRYSVFLTLILKIMCDITIAYCKRKSKKNQIPQGDA